MSALKKKKSNIIMSFINHDNAVLELSSLSSIVAQILSPLDSEGNGTILLREFQEGIAYMVLKKQNEENAMIAASAAGMGGGTSVRRNSVVNPATGKTTIILASLDYEFSDALKEFDTDGNGEVTLDEIREGGVALRAKKKENKNLKAGISIGGIATVTAVGALSGILHVQLQNNKDTEIQSGTGNLMVKTSSTADDTIVEVSTKSRGSFFMAEMISDGRNHAAVGSSSNNGGIVCVSTKDLEEMALSVMGGSTHTNFAVTDVNGNVKVHDLSQNGVVDWNENSILLGSVTFAPSQGCTGVNEERKLDESDLTGLHTELRNRVFSKFGSMGRGGNGGAKAMLLNNKDSNEAQLRLGGRKLDEEDMLYEARVEANPDMEQNLQNSPTPNQELDTAAATYNSKAGKAYNSKAGKAYYSKAQKAYYSKAQKVYYSKAQKAYYSKAQKAYDSKEAQKAYDSKAQKAYYSKAQKAYYSKAGPQAGRKLSQKK